VLAYDIVPEGNKPVAVTIASEEGWSLVAVMAAVSADSKGAIAAISSRGLDVALRPLATSSPKQEPSLIAWQGPTRTTEERLYAKALAIGRPLVAAKPKKKKSKPRKRGSS
jgi:hypothetical protein